MSKDKQALFDVGIYLISMADEGVETKQLKEAIKQLELVIHTRENIPF